MEGRVCGAPAPKRECEREPGQGTQQTRPPDFTPFLLGSGVWGVGTTGSVIWNAATADNSRITQKFRVPQPLPSVALPPFPRALFWQLSQGVHGCSLRGGASLRLCPSNAPTPAKVAKKQPRKSQGSRWSPALGTPSPTIQKGMNGSGGAQRASGSMKRSSHHANHDGVRANEGKNLGQIRGLFGQ